MKYGKDLKGASTYLSGNVGRNAGAGVFGKISNIDPTTVRFAKFKAIFKASINATQKQQLESILDTQRELLSPNTSLWKKITLRARLGKERSTLRKSLSEAQADQFSKVNRLAAAVYKNEATFMKAGQKIANRSTSTLINKL